MSKVLSFRASDEDAEWADGYAKTLGVTRQAFLLRGFLSFKEDCERGVPDVRAEPAPAPVRKTKPASKLPASFADPDGSRQQRLNAAMLRARGSR